MKSTRASSEDNQIVRAKLRAARRPIWPTRARWASVSQKQIAMVVGISQAQLSYFEHGRDLDVRTLKAIDKALVKIAQARTVEGFRLLEVTA